MRRPHPGAQPIGRLSAKLAALGVRLVRLAVPVILAVQIGAAQSPQAAGETIKRKQTEQAPTPATSTTAENTQPKPQQPADELQEMIKRIAASGRIQQIGESSAARLNPAPPLAPGAPPILAFRYFDGQSRHRFGDLDLVMDDAGH